MIQKDMTTVLVVFFSKINLQFSIKWLMEHFEYSSNHIFSDCFNYDVPFSVSFYTFYLKSYVRHIY